MSQGDNARANNSERAGSEPVSRDAKCASAATVVRSAVGSEPDLTRILEDGQCSTVHQEVYTCAVCEEPARGFHFGAFTCEGCKSFFGRTCLRKNHERFECKNAGRCDVIGANRTSCKACRYKRCVSVGMSPLNCRGVTFTGVIIPHKGEPNCLLVACHEDSCEMNEPGDYSDGLISVLINRTQVEPTVSANFSLSHSTTLAFDATSTDASETLSPAYSTVTPFGSSTVALEQSTTAATHKASSMALAPVWAVGLAIVIAVVCVGLNLGLLSAYICYRRQKSRKHTMQITANKGPTLHAYNPTI